MISSLKNSIRKLGTQVNINNNLRFNRRIRTQAIANNGMKFFIRDASIKDIDEISSVHVQSWKEAYKNIIDPQYLKLLDSNERINSWSKILIDKDNFSILAIHQSKIVGFASGGQERDNNKSIGEIHSIYLLEQFQGLGMGSALWKNSSLILKNRGFNRSRVWVLENNKKAIDFYLRNSCSLMDIQKEIYLGNKAYNQICFEWDL